MSDAEQHYLITQCAGACSDALLCIGGPFERTENQNIPTRRTNICWVRLCFLLTSRVPCWLPWIANYAKWATARGSQNVRGSRLMVQQLASWFQFKCILFQLPSVFSSEFPVHKFLSYSYILRVSSLVFYPALDFLLLQYVFPHLIILMCFTCVLLTSPSLRIVSMCSPQSLPVRCVSCVSCVTYLCISWIHLRFLGFWILASASLELFDCIGLFSVLTLACQTSSNFSFRPIKHCAASRSKALFLEYLALTLTISPYLVIGKSVLLHAQRKIKWNCTGIMIDPYILLLLITWSVNVLNQLAGKYFHFCVVHMLLILTMLVWLWFGTLG